ncbi:MAG: twin-arginine translocation signal domain-containing protein [Selenomonadaceae bacterium]|nr:twin-arginine translocation signal domain-containing protein [Selenomonadaceae bacterium]MBQ1915569.1 twin-arginine translocation signal domain-containing protein [Selenomonadaceae bacterium]
MNRRDFLKMGGLGALSLLGIYVSDYPYVPAAEEKGSLGHDPEQFVSRRPCRKPMTLA